ncbi:2-hydroxyacid dehydrogenase [Novosphingobium nitrogenifigens]|uniref:2-hydroxyacid dehydrogenase n=1 Tax=Novosphingobium nitrogenifigens TaxID=378548 RepID=UPI000A9EFCE8|nr:2-hydroxyacid dehydrogenase [Novosphingobium nitrogenifigens]
MTDLQSRPEIVVPAPLPPFTLTALERLFTVHRLWEGIEDAALARVRGMAASTLAGPVGEDLFARLPALEIIANFGVGYDNIDVAAAAVRGIVVTNTAGVLDEEVADLTIGLLLATLRRIPAAERFLRDGRWNEGPFPLSPSLRGRRVGILGLGGIGKAVARRLEGFAVPIAYHGRTRQEGLSYPWYASAEELAENSDVLIVIVPGGVATRHMVDARVLTALGPDGVLVNVSRGTVVDEVALVAALESGTILAAGLDVFDREPHVPEALLAAENVVLLPHIGSGSRLTREAMGQLMVDNLGAWFGARRVLTPVAETRHLIPA